jgi:hypothetical protein
MNYDTKSILEMDNGAFLELSNYEMSKIMQNIRDPNAKNKARKLTLTFTFIPDANGENISVDFDTKTVLSPTNTRRMMLYVAGEDSTGALQVVEMTSQLPGQLSFDGNEREMPAILRLVE